MFHSHFVSRSEQKLIDFSFCRFGDVGFMLNVSAYNHHCVDLLRN